MSEGQKALIFLVIFIVFWVLFYHIWRHFRSLRLMSLAHKYNLKFSKNYKLFYPDLKGFNFISGIVGNHKVEIFDIVQFKSYGTLPGSGGLGRGIDKYYTSINIDSGHEEKKGSLRFAKIGYIESKLMNLL